MNFLVKNNWKPPFLIKQASCSALDCSKRNDMDKASVFLEDCNAADTESHGKNSVNAKFTPLSKGLSRLMSYSVETNASNE